MSCLYFSSNGEKREREKMEKKREILSGRSLQNVWRMKMKVLGPDSELQSKIYILCVQHLFSLLSLSSPSHLFSSKSNMRDAKLLSSSASFPSFSFYSAGRCTTSQEEEEKVYCTSSIATFYSFSLSSSYGYSLKLYCNCTMDTGHEPGHKQQGGRRGYKHV